ncbi:hypothetical protein F5J12DRAFT_845624, partial [Pisolithus orientalis]|uniref:uncharacterized protein n=1 Tax=Pisolithus orientalis TaxID=936130 RepID=UPI0022259BA7
MVVNASIPAGSRSLTSKDPWSDGGTLPPSVSLPESITSKPADGDESAKDFIQIARHLGQVETPISLLRRNIATATKTTVLWRRCRPSWSEGTQSRSSPTLHMLNRHSSEYPWSSSWQSLTPVEDNQGSTGISKHVRKVRRKDEKSLCHCWSCRTVSISSSPPRATIAVRPSTSQGSCAPSRMLSGTSMSSNPHSELSGSTQDSRATCFRKGRGYLLTHGRYRMSKVCSIIRGSSFSSIICFAVGLRRYKACSSPQK